MSHPPPVLDFCTALGFEVIFEQRSPNPYAVVRRGGIELHFFGMKRYEPSESYSTCIVGTDGIDGLYAAVRAGLKAAYGRIPTRGLPRIGALKDTSHGTRQFLLTDPGGNCLRIGQPISEDRRHRPTPVELLRLLVLRADVAGRLEDEAGMAEALAGAAAVRLTDEERETVRDDLARLDELRTP